MTPLLRALRWGMQARPVQNKRPRGGRPKRGEPERRLMATGGRRAEE